MQNGCDPICWQLCQLFFFRWENISLQFPLCPRKTESPDRLEVTGFEYLLWRAGFDSGCFEWFFLSQMRKILYLQSPPRPGETESPERLEVYWVRMPALWQKFVYEDELKFWARVNWMCLNSNDSICRSWVWYLGLAHDIMSWKEIECWKEELSSTYSLGTCVYSLSLSTTKP